jgi:hypothetical protein
MQNIKVGDYSRVEPVLAHPYMITFFENLNKKITNRLCAWILFSAQ